MAQGLDLSHWNIVKDWGKINKDFIISKCTEGIYYKDPTYDSNKLNARKNNILFGAYHFAKGGDAKKEANFFWKNVGDLQKGELLILDFEIKIDNPVAWCLTFLKELERLCGFKPLIYLSSSFVKSYDWSPVVKNNNGLWLARYYLNLGVKMGNPSSGQWPFWVIYQYTSRGLVGGIKGLVDLDYTNCDIKTLKKYGK